MLSSLAICNTFPHHFIIPHTSPSLFPYPLPLTSSSSMALSLSTMKFPFTRHGNHTFSPSKPTSSTQLITNKLFYQSDDLVTKKPLPKVSAVTDNNSLRTVIDDLKEEEKAKDRKKNAIERENQLKDRWPEIHGKDDWNGLLDPMDPLLRSELIRYGEMAQATYDAFDFDSYSKYCGSCRYIRRKFFESLQLTHLGYEASRYLYATSNNNLSNFFKKTLGGDTWSLNANWMGYVAVSNDETSTRLGRRDITVAWRGTVTELEWMEDIMDFLRPVILDKIPCPDPKVKVESGFLDVYTEKDPNCRFCKYTAREQILTEIRRLVEMYKDEKLSITITGHSLGAALAVLSAYDIVETGVNVSTDGKSVPVSVFSFSGPRVGNQKFKERLEGLGIKVLRVVNVHDTVPKVPGLFLNEHVPLFVRKIAEGLPWSYAHVGVELQLDHKVSPYLSEANDIANFHNLEAHLHLLDGYHGKGKEFALSSGRDPALVNKSSNFLKGQYSVPPSWMQPENKGLVRTTDGRWMLPERPRHDDHPPETDHHLNELGLVSPQDN